MINTNEKTLTLGIGTILVRKWGYSMILVDFYRVIEETAKTVLVQALGSIETPDGFLTGYAIPDKNKILLKQRVSEGENEEERLRIYKKQKNNDWLLISSKNDYKKYFSKWDGQPEHYDHCD
jgi:hypothetical protein